jgi:hypothetical protein
MQILKTFFFVWWLQLECLSDCFSKLYYHSRFVYHDFTILSMLLTSPYHKFFPFSATIVERRRYKGHGVVRGDAGDPTGAMLQSVHLCVAVSFSTCFIYPSLYVVRGVAYLFDTVRK